MIFNHPQCAAYLSGLKEPQLSSWIIVGWRLDWNVTRCERTATLRQLNAGGRCSNWLGSGSGGSHKTIQILKIPLAAGYFPTSDVPHNRAELPDQHPSGESIAAGLLLPAVASGSADQPVVKLMQEDEKHQFIGV